jgi:hypothetical protein
MRRLTKCKTIDKPGFTVMLTGTSTKKRGNWAMLTRLFLGIMLLVSGAALAQTSFPDHCPGGSPLPFAAIEVKHPIDSTCSIEGTTTAPANSHTQNKVKSNFCAAAPGGQPETVTPQKLVDLQAHTKIHSGFKLEPSDRKPLQDLGEGKVVRMKAFLIEAHYADLGAGESANCNGKKEPDNDIHIAFGSKADSQECESVSAEIIPHYRPASWSEIGHFETYNSAARKYIPNAAMASRLQAHSYRITGQLFFDASHAPCPCSKACNPIRASVWEIHPVYSIEVCKGTTCDENNDSDWIAFDTWWKGLVPIKKVKGPHTHTRGGN